MLKQSIKFLSFVMFFVICFVLVFSTKVYSDDFFSFRSNNIILDVIGESENPLNLSVSIFSDFEDDTLTNGNRVISLGLSDLVSSGSDNTPFFLTNGGRGLAVFLNILPGLGIGSFAQGHWKGGLVLLTLDIVGYLGLLGFLAGGPLDGAKMLVVTLTPICLITSHLILGIIFPIFYKNCSSNDSGVILGVGDSGGFEFGYRLSF